MQRIHSTEVPSGGMFRLSKISLQAQIHDMHTSGRVNRMENWLFSFAVDGRGGARGDLRLASCTTCSLILLQCSIYVNFEMEWNYESQSLVQATDALCSRYAMNMAWVTLNVSVWSIMPSGAEGCSGNCSIGNSCAGPVVIRLHHIKFRSLL